MGSSANFRCVTRFHEIVLTARPLGLWASRPTPQPPRRGKERGGEDVVMWRACVAVWGAK
jgi:hypothetical protein